MNSNLPTVYSSITGSSIIIAGGYTGRKKLTSVEMISDGTTENFQECEDLPKQGMCSLILHKNKILSIRYDSKICQEMVDGNWKRHSTLVEYRGPFPTSAVRTNYGTFIFGGDNSKYTYEFLLHGSSQWQIGQTKIPDGFTNGFTIALKSKPEIWLIGGYNTRRRILSFNLQTHSFTVSPTKLLVGRTRFQCSSIPNTNKVIVTGGYDLSSTEILDTVDGTVTMASPMRGRRSDHGIGIVTVNGVDKVAVFGGYGGIAGSRRSREGYLKTVEIYNPESEEWEDSKFELKEGKAKFGFVSVNNKLIMPN